MALNLNLHANLGTMTFSQVDANWSNIQGGVNLLEASQIQNNFSATVDPTTANNASQGYSNGSRWYNRTTPKLFICVDAGAGTWVEETAVSGSLGSGAYSDVTVSDTDTTAGRLLKVGDFGLGGQAQIGVFNANTLLVGGTWFLGSGSTNIPSGFGLLQVIAGGTPAGRIRQVFSTYVSPVTSWERASGDGGATWAAWQEAWHSGNTIVDGSGFIKEA